MAITISTAILDLCFRKTRADKSRDYRDLIVLEKLHFQNVFCPHLNTKLRFQISPFIRAFSKSSVFGGQFLRISVEESLTGEIKLHFQILSAYGRRGLILLCFLVDTPLVISTFGL